MRMRICRGTYRQYGSASTLLTQVRYRIPNLGIVNQFFPEAVFKQNQAIVNVNARINLEAGAVVRFL